jgi:hypothetical protein
VSGHEHPYSPRGMRCFRRHRHRHRAPASIPTAGRGAARQREVQIRTTETASEDSNTSLSSPLQERQVSGVTKHVGRESC